MKKENLLLKGDKDNMDIRNKALIISENGDFISNYGDILQRYDFEVLKTNIKSWNENGHYENGIDICLIDNQDGTFNFDEFFKKFNSKSLIVNVSDKEEKSRKKPGLLYNLHPDSNTIKLEIFLKNINLLLERDKARMELAATLLHDLRSPLNSLVSYMELLINETFGELNEGQKNFLEKAMILGDQVLDMVEEINEVYQNEQYTFHLEKEKISLPQLIDEALLKIWIQADAKDIKIKKELPDKLPEIYGDPFQIQRVFSNVLGNSIKYCPENSRIILKASPPKNKFIEIEIMDNGGGIPESQLKKIFNKYHRVEQKPVLDKGQGLGLYISKLIVKAHKGKIRAINNQMGGLSFVFSLPTV